MEWIMAARYTWPKPMLNNTELANELLQLYWSCGPRNPWTNAKPGSHIYNQYMSRESIIEYEVERLG